MSNVVRLPTLRALQLLVDAVEWEGMDFKESGVVFDVSDQTKRDVFRMCVPAHPGLRVVPPERDGDGDG